VLSPEFENVVVLSDEFYREVSSHPLPNDLEAVKVLAGSPAVLDLYIWLTYRCFKRQEPRPSDLRRLRSSRADWDSGILAAPPLSRHVGAVVEDHQSDLAGMPARSRPAVSN
jgi:hypothetical protein